MGTLLIANRDLVKKADPDRYICTLFADREVQEFLFAIYALYNELAAIPFRTQEANLGEIRLQWWRETLLASKLEVNLSTDPIMQGIYKLNGQPKFNRELMLSIIDERENDLSKRQPKTIEELEKYIKNTSGAITVIALDLMDVTDEHIRQACQDIALAYGLIGVLRSTRFLLNYDRILVPESLLDRYEVSNEIFKNRKQNQSLRSIGAAITGIGESLLLKARKSQQNIERRSMPCLLLASLTGLYIKQLKRLNYDVFDLRLSQPANWRAWVLAFNYCFKKF